MIHNGAVLQVGEEINESKAGEELWINANEKHRLSCKGSAPVRVLEVVFGSWQQDNIKRYNDDYKR